MGEEEPRPAQCEYPGCNCIEQYPVPAEFNERRFCVFHWDPKDDESKKRKAGLFNQSFAKLVEKFENPSLRKTVEKLHKELSEPSEKEQEENLLDCRGFVFPAEFSYLVGKNVPPVNFSLAKFGVGARFEATKFSENTNFEGTRFLGDVSFSNAEFGNINSASIDKLSFEGTVFCGNASFGFAKFYVHGWFHSAKFCLETHFRKTKFQKEATFYNSTFTDRALFIESEFYQAAFFTHAKFGDGTSFLLAKFQENANFEHAIFGDRTRFQDITFESSVSFEGATALGSLSFSGEPKPSASRVFSKSDNTVVNFQRVRFENPRMVNISSVNLERVSLLNTDVSEINFTDVDWPKDSRDNIHFLGQIEEGRFRPIIVTTLEWLERLCQQLKLNFENRRNYYEAGEFHWAEMTYRRQRILGDPERKLGWRGNVIALWSYQQLSGYGERIGLSLRILFWSFLFVVFTQGLLGIYHGPSWAVEKENFPCVRLDNRNFRRIGILGDQDLQFLRIPEDACPRAEASAPEILFHAGKFTLLTASFQRPEEYEAATWPGRVLSFAYRIFFPIQLGLLLVAIKRRFRR